MDSAMDSLPATASAPHQSSIPQHSVHHPSATQSSSGPQIRSRITVVCAECKRLKLKCDRRNPCGSCTKRDTVARCIYSPAAAEKVDLHSLNNRLIQVESTLALITAGQTPPAFISSYPPSQAQAQAQGITLLTTTHSSAPTPSLHSIPNAQPHVHHHHVAVPSSSHKTLLTIPMEDVVSLWLSDLDLGATYPIGNPTPPTIHSSTSALQFSSASTVPSFGTGASNGNGYIKLESSPVELSHTGNPSQPIVVDGDFDPSLYSHDVSQSLHKAHSQASTSSYLHPSRSPSPDSDSNSSPGPFVRRRRRRPLAAQATNQAMHLPPLGAYYSSPDHYDGRAHYHHSKRPGIPHDVFPRFPHISTCFSYLDQAERVLRAKAWTSTYMFFSASTTCEGKSLAKALLEKWLGCGLRVTPLEGEERTHTIVFSGDNAGSSESRINSGNGDPGDGGSRELDWETASLPLFMGICAVLAIGALAYLDTICAGEGIEEAAVQQHRHTADFLFALSGQAAGVWEDWVRNNDRASSDPRAEYGYGSSQEQLLTEEIERDDLAHLTALLLQTIFLVLDQSLDVATSSGREENPNGSSETFRRNSGLLPLLGKLVTSARALGLAQDPHFSPSDETWGRNEAGDFGEKEIERADRRRRIWWDILFFDLFVSDTCSQPPLIMHNSYDTRFPSLQSTHGASSGMSSITSPFEQPSRLERQDDNPEAQGFTSSQYIDARYRLIQLTRTMKHRMMHPDCCCGYTLEQAASLEGEIQNWMASSGVHSLSSALESIECQPSTNSMDYHEFISKMQRCELALWGWKSILRLWTPFLRPPHSNSTSGSNWSAPYQATRSTVSAAQGIIRATQSLFGLWKSASTRTLADTPVIMNFYPLERTLLDAVAVCSHAGMFGRAMWGAGVIDDASDGLRFLGKLGVTGKSTFLCRVVGALRRRVEATRGGPGTKTVLKRKHDQIETARDRLGTAAESSADIASSNSNAGLEPTSGPMTESGSYSGLDSSLEQPQPPRGSPRAPLGSSRMSSTSPDQDKRFTKRSPTYPPVGIRMRGKDSTSPGRQRPAGSKHSSPSSSAARIPDERMAPPPPNPRIVGAMEGINFQAGHFSQTSHSQPIAALPRAQELPPNQRSRASSLSHEHYLHKPSDELTSTHMMDYSLPFPASETAHIDNHSGDRRRFQETAQGEGSFMPSIFDATDSGLTSFDAARSFDAHQRSTYDRSQPSRAPSEALFTNPTNTTTSSPYENSSVSAPISTSNSPYVPANGIPPSFGPHSNNATSSQNPSPPTFGPSAASSSFYISGNHSQGNYGQADNSVIHGPTAMSSSATIPKAMTNGNTMMGATTMHPTVYENKGAHMDSYQHSQPHPPTFGSMNGHSGEQETRHQVHNMATHVQVPPWSTSQHLQTEASYWTSSNEFKFYQ
ncbi:hypothetical protein AX16_006782 [Volvariella volvacea WC 439]|nr:hypothetical protein AX16_006782 [Volvariella volvacea WC 439]